MTPWTISLLVGALIAAALSYNSRVALLWIIAGATDFTLTYLYASHPLPWLPHAFITGAADASLIVGMGLLTLALGAQRQEWEVWVRRCFMLSVLCSMAYLFHWIPDQTTYAIALEGCNWAALLIIGGHGILRLADEGLARGMVGSAARSSLGRGLHRARTFSERQHGQEGILASKK